MLEQRILIIDDNPAIHEDMRKILLSDSEDKALQELEADLFGASGITPTLHYRIDSAFQGKDGLAKVRQALAESDPYAVAFVDVRMPPGWDGVETVEHIWKEAPDLQVVLCTAYSDHSWTEIVARLGHTDNLLILKKPFDPIELHQMASALSRKWSLQREDRAKLQLANEELKEANKLLALRFKELKEAQAQLIQAEKMAAVGQLASGLAHEINTPIQFVGSNVLFMQGAFQRMLQGFSGMQTLLSGASPEISRRSNELQKKLQLGYLQEEVPSALSQSMEGLDRVGALVRAMREFASPSRGKKVAIDLKSAIQNTLTITQSAWSSVADVELLYDPDLEQLICLQDELNQVFLQVLVNATHAIEDVAQAGQKGKIKIQTLRREPWAEIRISDTGRGIPEEIRHRIFEPFFTTKEVGKGTGQGLAIAYSIIVDKHQGQIDFISEVGKGTTFILRLPLTPS